MNTAFSRALHNNPAAMRAYRSGKLPKDEDILTSLFVEGWRRKTNVPDHYLKNRLNYVLEFDGTKASDLSLAQTVLRVLEDTGERFLKWSGHRLLAREETFAEWQTLLPSISPLLVQAYMVLCRAGQLPRSPGDQAAYCQQWLLPNFRSTALPYPANPFIDGLIRRSGLTEIHCHLNGSTEADYVCLDALARPREFGQPLIEAWQSRKWGGKSVREQYEQVESGLNPGELCLQLQAARHLRRAICTHLFDGADLSLNIVQDIMSDSTQSLPSWKTPEHPAEEFLWQERLHGSLVLEAAYLIQVLSHLRQYEDPVIAHAFFFCQLVSAKIIKITVQQVEQFGFDQFQKITINEARQLSEKDYNRRFFQMDVTDSGDIAAFEGRFAPKDSAPKILDLTAKIEKGFKQFRKETKGVRRMKLSLVCHFIKAPEANKPAGCRFYLLREDLAKQGRALIAAHRMNHLSESKGALSRLCGIDAASNEMHTPPEVFAPVFRQMRRRGVQNVTYHVGEDFVHLLSGIRAIRESIKFLKLSDGHRIGHGTAIGIDPELWCDRIGPNLYIAQGEYLDNLVFAHHILMAMPSGLPYLGKITDEIAQLSIAIYGHSYAPHILHSAWELRELDPLLIFNDSRRLHILDPFEMDEEEALWTRLPSLAKKPRYGHTPVEPDAEHLFRFYHGQAGVELPLVMKRWNKLIEVDTYFIPPDALWEIQETLLRDLVARNVAIESMPTSNVRISMYDDYTEHHIFRWLGIAPKSGEQPIVCLGSDDPGIFATSIRAEYCHIYNALISKYGKSPETAIDVLERLIRNSEVFRFAREKNLAAPQSGFIEWEPKAEVRRDPHDFRDRHAPFNG